ncbi:MAG: DUF2007 domain-containing protein [Armatimonadetes bacterium]|jgi:hypothetical protein|nr:DUF2007 domain-containing protein [Armatimonadota bacterium]
MENPEQEDKLEVVYRAADEYTANLVSGLLNGEGITAVLESRQVPWMDGVFKTGEGYWGDVVVPAKDAQRSRELIEAYESEQPSEDDNGQ